MPDEKKEPVVDTTIATTTTATPTSEDVKKAVADAVAELQKSNDEKLKEAVRIAKEQVRADLDKSKEESRKKEEELAKARKAVQDLENSATMTAEELAKAKKDAALRDEMLAEAEIRTKKLVDGVSNEFREILSKKDLEIYKKSKIAENAGEIISELVMGSTVEEIDKATEYAKAKYNEIVDKATKKKNEQELENGKVPGMTSSVGNTSDFDYKGLLTMSGKDFDEYSQKMFKEYANKTGARK